MKIIIVDDDIITLQSLLNDLIDVNDIEFKFFKDKKEAILDYVKENKIDKALLDINMPSISGIELAKELIAIDENFKIAFLTGLNITKEEIDPLIQNNVIGIIYKPYNADDLNHYLKLLRNSTEVLEVKMFNSFDCYIDGKVVTFSSKKSKELFALLLAYNGKTLEMYDAISQLWPNHDIDKAKILYRDAVWRLRKTLDECSIRCVTFSRGSLCLETTNIHCDYYDYLKGKNDLYNGSFCKSYEFAKDYITYLDRLQEERRKDACKRIYSLL